MWAVAQRLRNASIERKPENMASLAEHKLLQAQQDNDFMKLRNCYGLSRHQHMMGASNCSSGATKKFVRETANASVFQAQYISTM
jgi:hypothetical protein